MKRIREVNQTVWISHASLIYDWLSILHDSTQNKAGREGLERGWGTYRDASAVMAMCTSMNHVNYASMVYRDCCAKDHAVAVVGLCGVSQGGCGLGMLENLIHYLDWTLKMSWFPFVIALATLRSESNRLGVNLNPCRSPCGLRIRGWDFRTS